MTNETKTEIQVLLKIFIEQYPSQAKAVAKLKNVSEATVIQVVKGNWNTVSEDMWRNIGKQVGWDLKGDWILHPTKDMNRVFSFLNDARKYANIFSIIGASGSGKSTSIDAFSKKYKNVFIVTCAGSFTEKIFLQSILRSMGIDYRIYRGTMQLLDAIEDNILRLDFPVIVLDEFDKCMKKCILSFIDLSNRTKKGCGLVTTSTVTLENIVNYGYRNGKPGYEEYLSRVSNYIYLKGASKDEVKNICNKNGVVDPVEIATMCNQVAEKGDLRRIERRVHAIKMMEEEKDRSNAA